ncbi:MAG: polysaccharide biosynthesis C-terminal domain-containing protein [Bacteroidales bacterium]|nr:polysaccharide biosynthesis C-terminal domain-containing protein [Bacteroidales bacterium]
MDAREVKKNMLSTVFGKSLILLLSFGMVVFTTRFFGAEGRGFIALFAANVNFILIVSSIFSGSSVSYYLSKVGFPRLYTHATLWILLVSFIGVFISFLLEGESLSFFLFFISVLLGFLTFHFYFFIASQKIAWYNLASILQPLLHLVCMLGLYYTIIPNINAYFYGQLISLLILVLFVRILSYRLGNKVKAEWDTSVFKDTFKFGFQVELSSLFQFLNYRLPYYFLQWFAGTASVGVFSIGVTLTESLWIISRSISMVQYSKMLEDNDMAVSWKETLNASKISLYFTIIALLIVFFIPDNLFALIFGNEFAGVKTIMIWMSPGILAVAVSNVYGHYFSAFGKVRILILKSVIGVVVTVILSFWLIPQYFIVGASVSTSLAHIASSGVLFYCFFRKRKR